MAKPGCKASMGGQLVSTTTVRTTGCIQRTFVVFIPLHEVHRSQTIPSPFCSSLCIGALPIHLLLALCRQSRRIPSDSNERHELVFVSSSWPSVDCESATKGINRNDREGSGPLELRGAVVSSDEEKDSNCGLSPTRAGDGHEGRFHGKGTGPSDRYPAFRFGPSR